MSSRWIRTLIAIAILLVFLVPASVSAQGQTHTVQPGETLFRIALNYGTTVEALMAANNLADPSRIFVGQVLVIPGSAPVPQPAQPASNPATSSGTYTVVPGDTLNIIARKLGVSVQALIAANNITDPNHIEPGQQLVVPGSNAAPADTVQPTAIPPTAVPPAVAPTAPPPTALAPAQSGTQTHIVQPGETLASIARKYNVTWPDIAAANNITDPNHIFVGMSLVIPAPGSSPASSVASSAPPGPIVDTGKQIVVILHEQRVYLYEDGQLLKSVLVSTGMAAFPTVQGDFRIYVKYRAQLMTGPGYYLPGVPWVMYFYQGYGLHGTYWHHNWGHPMSHGCVNMPTDEAKWVFDWAPVGTPVHVRW